jgi:hypothetical protein
MPWIIVESLFISIPLELLGQYKRHCTLTDIEQVQNEKKLFTLR